MGQVEIWNLPPEMPLYFYVILSGLSGNCSLEISGRYDVNVASPSPKTGHLFLNIHFKFIFCFHFVYHTPKMATQTPLFSIAIHNSSIGH